MMNRFHIICFRIKTCKRSLHPCPAAISGPKLSWGRCDWYPDQTARVSRSISYFTSSSDKMPRSDVHKCQSCPGRDRAPELILYVKQCSIQFYWSIMAAGAVWAAVMPSCRCLHAEARHAAELQPPESLIDCIVRGTFLYSYEDVLLQA